jgi:hypothetical protein
VLWSIDTATLNSATYGIECKTRHITAKNIFCQTISSADYYLPTDASLTVEGFGSELGGRLVKADDGFDITFRRGYFQNKTANVTASGRIIDLTSTTTGSITMEDVNIYSEGGYAGPTPTFYVRAAKALIRLKNVALPNAIDTFFDFTTASAGHTRHVILENVIDSTGAVFNGNFYWTHGDYAPTFSTEALGQQHKIVLTGSTTWNIPNTADGGVEPATVTVTGARVGDFASASLSTLPANWFLQATVTANDTVSVIAYNRTGGASDPGSGTLRAMVVKF